jgi:hemerythrin-like metal-binding protein
VYVETSSPIEKERWQLLPFFTDQVSSSMSALSHAKHAERASRATVVALASLAEHKDQNTGDHILRVARMTDELVQMLENHGHYRERITPTFKRFIGMASVLHDVGKVAVPDAILQKPGRLDPDERKIIETHTLKGRRVLEKASRILEGNDDLIELAAEVALYHHERYDGRGYPEGLAGEAIPLSARIVGLADVYDALSSRRPYKKAWTEEETVGYIAEEAGGHFDPILVDAFQRVMAHRREATLVRWTPDMSVCVERLDEDHQLLIALINQVAAAEHIGNRRIVESVLDELVNYTIEHFRREEAYMRAMDYPAMSAHMLLHAAFTESIQDIRWQYLHGLRPNISGDVLSFLRDWLSKHILVEDREYVRFASVRAGAGARLTDDPG